MQTSQINHDFENCRFEVSQLLWGTHWNEFVFEKRILSEPSIWLGGKWSGWSAWSSSSVWAGKEIQIFTSGSGIKMVGWTLLGGCFERLKEINVNRINGVSELGISIEIIDGVQTSTLEAQLFNVGDEWQISTFIELSETSELTIGAGMNSDLSGHGWSLFVRKRIENIEVSVNLKGPQLYFSCGIRRLGKMNSALLHTHGAVGGSTNWSLKW